MQNGILKTFLRDAGIIAFSGGVTPFTMLDYGGPPVEWVFVASSSNKFRTREKVFE